MSDQELNGEVNKEELLGSVVKKESVGGFYVDYKKLKVVLEEGEIVRNFCADCDSYVELIEEGAKELAKKSGFSDLKDFTNMYFESNGCIRCNNDFKNVKLKPIVKTEK